MMVAEDFRGREGSFPQCFLQEYFDDEFVRTNRDDGKFTGLSRLGRTRWVLLVKIEDWKHLIKLKTHPARCL